MNIFAKKIIFSDERSVFEALSHSENFKSEFSLTLGNHIIFNSKDHSLTFLWEVYKEAAIVQKVINYSYEHFIVRLNYILYQMKKDNNLNRHMSLSALISFYYTPEWNYKKKSSSFIKNYSNVKNKEKDDHFIAKAIYRKYKKVQKDKSKSKSYINKKLLKFYSNRAMRNNVKRKLNNSSYECFINKFEACDIWGFD